MISAPLFKIALLGAFGLILLASIGLWVLAKAASPPADLGVHNGKLAPCPNRPNCVSSQADPSDQVHFLPPIPYAGELSQTQARLRRVLMAQPRVTVRRDEPGYLRAEFKSKLFGFVDDVEFLLDPQAKQIHFRSASRVGYSDLGVNRARIQAIRRQLVR